MGEEAVTAPQIEDAFSTLGLQRLDQRFGEQCDKSPIRGVERGVPGLLHAFHPKSPSAADPWQTYNASRPRDLQVESRGIPHLAKNERDMGHPRIVCLDRF